MHYPKNDKPSTSLHFVLMVVMFALILLLGMITSVEGKSENGPGAGARIQQVAPDGETP